ncbi:MAG: IS4 family transposase [Thiobacillus sp.]|nr:IS4 family transposase [Thiobacillus sp.]MDP2979092.1 IS4 family transposase [Thiobacillus sp.]
MARTKAVLGVGARLSDYLSASLLARVYPTERVEQILDEQGVNSQRIRSLPASVTAYYCMALSLYPEAAYEEVFAVIAQGLAWAHGGTAAPSVAKSSISAARSKLGVAPLKELHRRSCLPLADAQRQPEAFYAGLRLVAIDGSNFEVPDEAANAAAFGYPGSRTGHAAYPQAQCAVLVECASHAILGANLGAYRSAEWTICKPLLSHLDATMLCMADRGFNGYRYWQAARNTGAQLLWRCASNRQLPVVTPLPDGSYLSVIYPDVKSRRTQQDGITLRVIEYSLPGMPEAQARYRLLTTLLDPERAPALELATLYHQRWEVEAVFDELKTHLQQRRRVLRSKTPDGVRQEFYGWVLAHYAVCWLMYRAADAHRLKQRSLSFTGHVQLMRRAQPRSVAFPPNAPPVAKVLVQ